MIDLHSHILPGLDDGARDLGVALEMGRRYAAQGVTHVACTPHILPGLYHNSGSGIREAVAALQRALDMADIPLRLVAGADNHVIPDFVARLRAGELLAIDDSRYVLVEPPHHVAPSRLDDLLFAIVMAGFTPIVTHPERLSWIERDYDLVWRLVDMGVWMQVTSGSLRGVFGQRARYWAERMLGEGRVHVLATDAHDLEARPPDLAEGRYLAERLVGSREAEHLVVTRGAAILNNELPQGLPVPMGAGGWVGASGDEHAFHRIHGDLRRDGLARRLWRYFV